MHRIVTAFIATIALGATAWGYSVPSGAVVHDIERDIRRCIFPLCGGYWVKEVNQRNLTCVDGTVSDDCYVWDIDLDNVTTNPRLQNRIRQGIGNDQILVAGHIEVRPVPNTSYTDMGVFVVDKIWFSPEL